MGHRFNKRASMEVDESYLIKNIHKYNQGHMKRFGNKSLQQFYKQPYLINQNSNQSYR